MGRHKTPAEAMKRLRDMKKKNPDYKWKNPLAGFSERQRKRQEEAKKRREFMRNYLTSQNKAKK